MTMDGFAAKRLRPLRFGILLALLSVAFGWGMGTAFGAAEDAMKGRLRADAEAVMDSVYDSDPDRADAILSKSWIYLKRAHLHAGVLGAASLAMILLLAMLSPPGRIARASAVLLGVGALCYGGIFWLLAGLKAPGLGSTGAAKESLLWLAVPSVGALLAGYGGVVIATLRSLFAAETGTDGGQAN